MDYKGALSAIQKQQMKTFCSLDKFRDNLPVKRRGLYWIWTKLSLDELLRIPTRQGTKEVPIADLVRMRRELNNICSITNDEYRIVFNGIGGYRTAARSFGLRERINQELNCNDRRTGTLNLLNRDPDQYTSDDAEMKKQWKSQWAVSFFDFDIPENLAILEKYGFGNNCYNEYANALELSWRIEFGVPILTRN